MNDWAGRAGPREPLRRGLPRWTELGFAATALLFAAPIIAVAAAAIRLSSAGPSLFRQRRVGREGRLFTLLKLRTMRVSPAGTSITARGDPRITLVGRMLRKTKVDELPALWSVVRGDMSLVGPRPEVPSLVDLDNPHWRTVLSARPGLTDPVTLRLRNEEDLLAAVDGDREAFYREVLQPYKLHGYMHYLRRRSWVTDIAVLLKTAAAIVRPRLAPAPTIEEVRRKPL